MIRITALMNNDPSECLSLGIEHGLSFLAETPQGSFLFDCGATGLFLDNAEKMGLTARLLHVRDLVCSHAHYDHAGGYPAAAECLNIKRLITGEGFFVPKYAKDRSKYTYLGAGFDRGLLDRHGVEHVVCKGLLRLDSAACLVGGFMRIYEFEHIPSRFVCGEPGASTQPDSFGDEICAVLESEHEVAVLVGCSHPGILNMLATVRRHFEKPVTSVWGGVHLLEASEERVKQTVEEMKNIGVRRLGLCHCSGEMVRRLAGQDPVLEVYSLAAGDCIVI